MVHHATAGHHALTDDGAGCNGAVVAYIIGGLWYSKILFGNAWMVALGKSGDDLGHPVKAMIWTAVGTLASASMMSWVIVWFGVFNQYEGALVGALLALGFVAPTMGANNLFEGRTLKLFLINCGHYVVAFAAMGAVLGGLR